MILPMLLAMLAGWINRQQQQVITYLQEENRVLQARLRDRRLRLTDTDRRRLAALAHPLGRTRLQEVATSPRPTRSYVGIGGSSHRSSMGANAADTLDDRAW
jgi:hypothetical protein